MGNVQFSGQNRDIPNYVLTSPKDNVFETHNIRFHIDGHYLTDFSDKGIEKFIDKNYNNKTGFLGFMGLGWGGKDLDLKEVKAFIQAAAANADKIPGMTFELTDPQLGLFDDDKIKLEDIKHSFSMDYKPVQGTSAGEVSFVDATRIQYDLHEAKGAESKANDAYKSAQNSYRDLQKDLTSATKERDKIAGRLGDHAVQRLAEVDGKLKGIQDQLTSLKTDMEDARKQLSRSDLPEAERRELRLAVRGMEMEQKDLEGERGKLRKELSEHHGFWSFLGGGSNMEDLRAANAAVEKATKALEAQRPTLDAARGRWEEAKRRREAVEHGASLADLDQAAAPKPEAPKPDPAKPDAAATEPATPQPAAADDGAKQVVGERELQQVLSLPADKQLEALNAIPAGDRDAFLKMADEYLVAGRQDNPMGLDEQTFKTFASAADAVAKVRNNALLSWGEDAQKAYFDRVGDDGAKDVLAQLDKQLFDQQLAAQAQALKARLQSRPQPKEEPVAPSGSEVQPTQPAAPKPAQAPGDQPAGPEAAPEPTGAQEPAVQPAVQPGAQPPVEEPVLPGNRTNPIVSNQPAQPITLDAFKALPPDEMLNRFADLAPADQDLVFSNENANTKGVLLMQLASQHIEDEATRERLSKLMAPNDKQDIVDQLDAIRQEAKGQPSPNLTIANDLLGMFAKQGVKPNASPAEVPQPPVQPAPEQPAAQKPAPKPPVKPAQKPAPKPAQQPAGAQVGAQKPAPKPAEAQVPAPKPAAPMPSAQELEWAEALANKIEASQKAGKPYQPTKEESEKYTDIQTRYAAAEENAASMPTIDDKVKALKGMEPIERMQAFNSLSLVGKKEVFVKLPLQMQTECLLSMTYDPGFEADRKGLVESLSPALKQNLAKAYADGLPAAEAVDADLKEKMQSLIKELGGAPAAKPAVQSVQPPATPVPSAGPVPQSVAPVQPAAAQGNGRLDMSTQLKQLKSVVTEKGMWGYGSVTNPQSMNQLVDQIWGMGTDANRQEMAKLLVDNKQSTLLAQILSNTTVEGDEVVKTLSGKDFPIKNFMNAIDDSHAFLMLHTLGQTATQNDAQGQKAAALINDTVAAYQKGWDREKPFTRLKQAATAEGFWDKMPKPVRDNIEHMLTTYWN